MPLQYYMLDKEELILPQNNIFLQSHGLNIIILKIYLSHVQFYRRQMTIIVSLNQKLNYS